MSSAPVGAVALLLGGTGTGAVPFNPWCDVQISPLFAPFAIPLVIPASGGFRLTAPLPASTPTPLEVAFQILVQDPTALGGVAASAPLRLRVEE